LFSKRTDAVYRHAGVNRHLNYILFCLLFVRIILYESMFHITRELQYINSAKKSVGCALP